MSLAISTVYNYKWEKPKAKSCPVKHEYTLVKKIVPISFNEDKSVKEYKEVFVYVDKKTKWHDFIQSFNLGSISEQVMNHLTKGTPLITGHTLPDGDYTQEALLKGAKIKRMLEKEGLSIDDLASILASQKEDSSKVIKEEVKEDSQNG